MASEDIVYKPDSIKHEEIKYPFGNTPISMVIVDRRDMPLLLREEEHLLGLEDYLIKNLDQLSHAARMIKGVGGPIGSGKTTLTKKISSWTGDRKFLERTDSPGLRALYSKGGEVYCGPVQFYLGSQREAILRTADKQTRSCVIDCPWYFDQLFREMFHEMGSLDPTTAEAIERFQIEGITKNRHLDLLVLLHASDDTLDSRVNNRGVKSEIQNSVLHLSDSEKAEIMEFRDKSLEYMRQYVPEEYSAFSEKLSHWETPQEIIKIKGIAKDYLARVNRKYQSRGIAMLRKTGFPNEVLMLNTDSKIHPETKETTDVRGDLRGKIPIMIAFKETMILHLLRNGFGVIEKANRKGLEIIPPWPESY